MSRGRMGMKASQHPIATQISWQTDIFSRAEPRPLHVDFAHSWRICSLKWHVLACDWWWFSFKVMITHEKTCPPYSALNVDTDFTTRAIGEANSIVAKKHCQDSSSPPGLSLVCFMTRLLPWHSCVWEGLVSIFLGLELGLEKQHCAWHSRHGMGLSSWVFQSGSIVFGGYVHMGPIHVPRILKSLRKHGPYSRVPHSPRWHPSADEAGLH